MGERKVKGFPAASPEHGAASQHVCAVRLPACSGTGCPSLSSPGMSAEGGEGQVKPRSLSAVRPSVMALGRLEDMRARPEESQVKIELSRQDRKALCHPGCHQGPGRTLKVPSVV